MKTQPFEHQIKASKFHLQRYSSADYSEQGTGKTWVAINVIEKRIEAGQIKRALIVCPASILHVWESEIEKHSSFLTFTLLRGSQRMEIFKEVDTHCYIISYDSLTSDIVKLAVRKCQQVIFDEVHKAKNIRAKRTRLALALARKIPYRLQMSGTPWPNSLEDIFSLFLILDRGATFGTNYYRFLERYFYARPIPRTRIKRYIAKPILKHILKKALQGKAIRYLKDTLRDIPPKIYQTIPVDLSPAQRKYYRQLSHDLPIEEFSFELPPNILAKYEKLQQIASGFLYLDNQLVELDNPKAQALLDLLPNVLAGGKKAVIACKYRYEIELLKSLLKGYHPLVLDGTTTNKGKVCNKFQTDPTHQVLIMQVGCGIGVTLTAADTMIFLSNTFNYADRYQSEDRIHRAGQRSRRVLYIDIIAKDTIDERILRILRKKKQRIEDTLDNQQM
ncbi:MAG: hypothetical protein DRO05_02355 [Thermoproteota archaeon]|nr:MAG: hypothetical protein DRO05_02355 [Candidatus Korarchaeota archaeon]